MSTITRARAERHSVKLTRPYTIARGTIDSVDIVYFELVDSQGRLGLGSASPAPEVTGESIEACLGALEEAADGLRGEDVHRLGRLRALARLRHAETPAALAAIDMALLDLLGQALGVPTVDFLGRRIEPLPTSITVGIKSTEEALEEAAEYLGRGFVCLKIKIGNDAEEDRDRLRRLRDLVGPEILLRVDGNQGYSAAEAGALEDLVRELDLELVEQPLHRLKDREQAELPSELRRFSAADESLHDVGDALRLASTHPPFGIFNIKLMKCGGPLGAAAISTIAETRGIELMWGCMDESVVSISAALHTALASANTRYLDLDGSFDLATDAIEGGFELRAGRLLPIEAPGLGVRWRS